MKLQKKIACALALVMSISVMTTGCGDSQAQQAQQIQQEQQDKDMQTYRDYYNTVSEAFNKFIKSSAEDATFKTYRESFDKALKENNYKDSKYYYTKIYSLAIQLRDQSAQEIQTIKDDLAAKEKTETGKEALKQAEYKKNKNLGESERVAGNYAQSKIYFKSCIDTIAEVKAKRVEEKKKEKEEKKKQKEEERRRAETQKLINDSISYRPETDNFTYDYLTSYYLTSGEVAGLTSEQRRYYVNTIYAAYGYRFSNSIIQNFFDYQSWYTPDYGIAVGDQNAVKRYFNSVAKANIKMLS